MAEGYTWSASRGASVYRLPGPDRLGWWAAVAMLMSILLHVIVFFILDDMKIAFKFQQAEELGTKPIDIRQVEVRPAPDERSLPPEDIIQPPADSKSLLDEIDLAALLPENMELDIKPEVKQAEYALQMQKPAMEGSPEAKAEEASTGFDVDSALPELGRQPESIRPAELGQVTVDPGAVSSDKSDIGKFTDDLIKQGANGKVEKGALDGVESLDNLLDLPPNILLNKRTLLPGDLLFEFNKSELRESAKLDLMKISLLMDRNPELYCWIEGHADLVGGDEFNLELSIRRAEAVKFYLVNSVRMDASRIYTRGFGRYEPLVTSGTSEEQSINRRVEIRMRKTPPTKDQMRVAPQKASIVEEALPLPPVTPQSQTQEMPPPKPILVKPKRVLLALPVEEPAPPRAQPAPPQAQPVPQARPVPEPQPTPAPRAAPVPKAAPVEETPPPMRALPAFPEVPRAAPVEEESSTPVPRALPIE